uniref:Uncharacterized protein n=1 Tax=Avena sativa TaxID=4498 RepID=A0ACD5XX29_AVESA
MGGVLGLVQVDQSTVAIKENFGKFNAVLEPGCHFLPWCIGDRIVGYLSLRVKQLDVRCETKTKDMSSSLLLLLSNTVPLLIRHLMPSTN